MSTMQKIIIGLVAVILVAFVGTLALSSYQRRVAADMQQIRQALGEAQERERQAEKDKVEAQNKAKEAAQSAEEWRKRADAATARLGAMEKRMQGLEAKLEALGPAKPVTNPQDMPATAPEIAKAMTSEGLEAQVAPIGVGMREDVAQRALALIKDGKEYPKAMERVEILQEQKATLTDERDTLTEALGNERQATQAATSAYTLEKQATEAATRKADAADERADLQSKRADAIDHQLSAEKPKKWLWSAASAAITALIFLL